MENTIIIRIGNRLGILLRKGVRRNKRGMDVKEMGRLMGLVRLIRNKGNNLDKGKLLVCIWMGSTIF